MTDEIIKMSEIELQDAICKAVFNSDPKLSAIAIYNKIYKSAEIKDLDDFHHIIELIKLNQNINRDTLEEINNKSEV